MYGIFGDLWSCLKDTTNKSHTKAKTGNDQDNGNNKSIFKKKERNTGILPYFIRRKNFSLFLNILFGVFHNKPPDKHYNK